MPANNNPFLDPPNFAVGPTLTPATPGELFILLSPDTPFYEVTAFSGGQLLRPRTGIGTSLFVGPLFPGATPLVYYDGTQCGSVPGYASRIESLVREGLTVTVTGRFTAQSVAIKSTSPVAGVLGSGLSFTASSIDWGDGTSEDLPLNNVIVTDTSQVSNGFGESFTRIGKSGSLAFAATHTYAAPRTSSGIVIRAVAGSGYIAPTLATHLPLDAAFSFHSEDGICELKSAPDAILDSGPIEHKWNMTSGGAGDGLSLRGGVAPDADSLATVAVLGPTAAVYTAETLQIFLAVSGNHAFGHQVKHLATPGYTGLMANKTRNVAPLSRAAVARSPSGRLAALRPQESQHEGAGVGVQFFEVTQSFDDGKSWDVTPLTGLFGSLWNDDYLPAIWFDDFGNLLVMGRDVTWSGIPSVENQGAGSGQLRPAPDGFFWTASIGSTGMPFSNPAQWKYVRSLPLRPAGTLRIAISRPGPNNDPAQIFAAISHGAGAWSAPALVADVPGNPSEITHNQAVDAWQEHLQGHSRLVVLHAASETSWFTEDLTFSTPWQEQSSATAEETNG